MSGERGSVSMSTLGAVFLATLPAVAAMSVLFGHGIWWAAFPFFGGCLCWGVADGERHRSLYERDEL